MSTKQSGGSAATDIQVVRSEPKTYENLGRYFYCEMRAGKHHVTVAVAPNHLQIIVHNASNRCWRGLGKQFPNLAAALAYYKTPAVRSMLELAVAQAATSADVAHDEDSPTQLPATQRDGQPNETLYNCCLGALPPDWSQFDAIEVHPVRVDPTGLAECLSYDERHEATVWTVYGHCITGGVEALTDVSTERVALQIARAFEYALRERGLLVHSMFDGVRS
jgi:hypothetical protein